MFRIGFGSDIHKFTDGKKLILGGVPVESTRGLLGHSDADVVLHALSDALLGAAALGDLGTYFPATDENKDRDSAEILREVCSKVWDRGLKIINVDVVILAEEPKLAPYREPMAERISVILNIDKSCVGVKFTTCEGLGAVGRAEGICAQAVVLLEKKYAK